MAIMLPTALFTALNRGDILSEARGGEQSAGTALLTDETRGHFLVFSRALAILLLAVYVPPVLSLVLHTHGDIGMYALVYFVTTLRERKD